MQQTFQDNEWHITLRKVLVEYFSESELQEICFDLRVDYETLPGSTKVQKAIELIKLSARTGRITELIDKCSDRRPNIPWISLKEAALGQPLVVIDNPDKAISQYSTEHTPKVARSRSVAVPIVVVLAVLGVCSVVAIWFITQLSNSSATTTGSPVSTAIEPTVVPSPEPSPSPTLEPTIIPYVVPINHVVSTDGVTLTVDYLRFETSKLMIHMQLDIDSTERPMNGCELPYLVKDGYGRIPAANIVERGGMFSRTDGSCFLEIEFLGRPGTVQEGWLVYRIASSQFITTGLYTLDNVGLLPLTTFEVR